MYKIANIDKFGRISIPKKMREILGIDESTTVYIEEKNHELIIRPIHTKNSDAVKKISNMKLPIEDWETMEQEIESGALNG
ncbi:MAG TPA: AbrB/MazE/SpoVT family DNA-binding domain-containing protein [archaeon]|nr:AbrB/MazE/SpoVT family DNA-binding domain-containing protein [archaeon]